MLKLLSTLVILLIPITSFAFNSVSANKKQQKKLDVACEEARQIALAPRKKEIYQECISKIKKDKTVCEDEAKAFNGNRINGAPMFYELPACEKAFNYRKGSNK